MKLLYSYIKGAICLSNAITWSVGKNQNRIRNKNNIIATAIARIVAYILLLTVYSLFTFSLSAQEPRKDSGADGQNPRLLLDLENCIIYKPRFGGHRLVLAKEPNADLIRFPIIEYEIDTTRLGYAFVGETIPDEILNMRLQVVNHPQGKTSTSLRELADRQFLVLDFWAKWCKPCLASMLYWETARSTIESDIHVVGVHMDFDYKAELEAKERGFKGIQIVGPETTILKRYLLPYEGIGPSVWIRNGKLFGISRSNPISHAYIFQLISGELKELPPYADQTKVERK